MHANSVYGWAVGALFVAILYVLSYAPAYRVMWDMTGDPLPYGGPWWVYRPVGWLIDKTPLQRPLLWWSDVWSVREQFELASVLRHPWYSDQFRDELYGDDRQDAIEAIRSGLMTGE